MYILFVYLTIEIIASEQGLNSTIILVFHAYHIPYIIKL